MPDKPSVLTSTLSMVWAGSTVFYGAMALMAAISVIRGWAPYEIAEKIMVWPTFLWTNLTSAYFTARKVNGEQKPTG